MPYYKISFKLTNRTDRFHDRSTIVYRQYKESDIDKVWHIVERKCREKWGSGLSEFECIIFSKRSADYQRYLSQIGSRKANAGFR